MAETLEVLERSDMITLGNQLGNLGTLELTDQQASEDVGLKGTQVALWGRSGQSVKLIGDM